METTGDYIVKPVAGEYDKAKDWIESNRFMGLKDEIGFDLLLVSGADAAIERIESMEFIESVEEEGIGSGDI